MCVRSTLVALLLLTAACGSPAASPTEPAGQQHEAEIPDAASEAKAPQVTTLCCQLNIGAEVACKPEAFYCWNQSGNLTGAGDCSKVTCVPGWGCGTSTYVPGDGGIGIVGPCN